MRVIAIESFKEGILRSFGHGELIGNLIPDRAPFNKIEMKNPCIRLDSGKYVWGLQCWWGGIDKFNKMYKNQIKEVIIVEIEDEILPLKNSL